MIIALPFNNADKARAERLLDAIYWIGGRVKQGHCVLIPASDVHPEFRRKCTIASELCFNSVEVLALPPNTGEKSKQINAAFERTAQMARDSFRLPWLWLEADCVPLKKTWLTDLFAAYSQQPKRFFGRFMQAKSGIFMHRVGIYPPNAYADLSQRFESAVPFERAAGIVPRAMSTKLINVSKWSEGFVIPPEAVLMNGDKTGNLIEKLIDAAPGLPNKVEKRAVVAK